MSWICAAFNAFVLYTKPTVGMLRLPIVSMHRDDGYMPDVRVYIIKYITTAHAGLGHLQPWTPALYLIIVLIAIEFKTPLLQKISKLYHR